MTTTEPFCWSKASGKGAKTTYRMLSLALLLLVSACIARVEGRQEATPEQFVFRVVPGQGQTDEATDALVEMLREPVADVDHRASVATPRGQMDFYRFSDDAVENPSVCTAILSEDGTAGSSCGEGDSIGADELRVPGIGMSDDWTTLEIQAGSGVAGARAVAPDSTVYRTNLVDGFGVIVYPTRRGSVIVQGLDRAGNAVGDPVSSEGPSGG